MKNMGLCLYILVPGGVVGNHLLNLSVDRRRSIITQKDERNFLKADYDRLLDPQHWISISMFDIYTENYGIPHYNASANPPEYTNGF